jgi:multidrug efflux pump
MTGMLGAANANRPKGDFTGDVESRSIRTDDQLLQASQYSPLVVAYRNGAPVRLDDVATVSDSVEDVRNSGYADLSPSILMFIFRQPGANILETVDRIEAELPRLQAEIPAAILQDRTGPIRASIEATQHTMEIAMILVILGVFAFLRSWRTTLVPAITVPVSLVAPFGALYLFGYTVDNLSLMALTIAYCENFWSLLKRGINGTYVSVEPYHLFRYLDEQSFRYNNRLEMNDADRFSAVISQLAGKRLTWNELTGKQSEVVR